MNILIVDSDIIQIKSLARGLKNRGYSVVTATGREESFSVLDEQGDRIDLLLTDLNLPHLDAFELIQKARTINGIFPAIIMTTYIDNELKEKLRSDPFISLIEKPFVLERLMHEINWFDLSHEPI